MNREENRNIVDRFQENLPKSPPEDGILFVDKPSGPTSHDIVAAVKRKYGLKTGHTGTLDPLASGLMILLLGKATKRADEFSGMDKSYLATLEFGTARDTYDSEGKIIFEGAIDKVREISASTIEQGLYFFRGKIEQTVPPFSAVKIDGRPLYWYMRNNKPIPKELPSKKITIYENRLEKFHYRDGVPSAEIFYSVSKGTYIRSLVHDMGMMMGVGAHITDLKRLSVGKWELSNLS